MLRPYTSSNIMAHHTVKLGSADSHVVVAKVAVSLWVLLTVPPTHSPRLSVAWAYDDDLETDTSPG